MTFLLVLLGLSAAMNWSLMHKVEALEHKIRMVRTFGADYLKDQD